MRIAHISDLHITAAPDAPGLTRPDAVSRARALMADLSAFPGLDLVVITGDTVNDARADEYAVLADVLAALTVPFLIVPGNHDDRDLLRACVPDRRYADPDLLHHVWQQDHVRVIALDSLSPGEVGGRILPPQLDWLETQLARPFDGHTLVALHHPPCAAGMGRLDGPILIEGAGDLSDLLDAEPRPATILCGHLHRPFTARFGHSMVCAATSTAFQFALDLGAPDEPPTVPEPYHYAVHLLNADGAHVIHHRFPDL
ncbi:MAG: metallophosphoesterase [Paracoccus sp. (in: a-proteobacteria)]|uniref:metallophosphoesterase n=1 Tax=Paracoccus sp. TaxID=267 RepID=UPI00391BE46B